MCLLMIRSDYYISYNVYVFVFINYKKWYYFYNVYEFYFYKINKIKGGQDRENSCQNFCLFQKVFVGNVVIVQF